MAMNPETRNGRSENNSSKNAPEPTRLTPETSEDESHSKKNLNKPKNGKTAEFEEKIRVGKDYQVVIQEMNPKLDNYPEKALLVWSPACEIPESKLEEYITLAKERYGYNAEQALGMLFWHKHDLEKAVIDLANFTPFPDEWSKEDKVLFEQAFQFHGKCFIRIRQMLPDKSIASLVKFYYSWKKTRSRTSVMDRQEKKKTEGVSENGSENGSPDDSDVEDKKWPIRGIRRTSRSPNRLQSMNSHAESSSSASKSSTSKVQDVKRFGGSVKGENKDTGYSSSSSSSNGAQKLSSLNCQNCTVECHELKSTSVGNFCNSCFLHYRRTGVMRPTQGPHNMGIGPNRPRSKSNKLYYYQGYHDGSSKYKRKPPKGFFINHDDALKLAAQDLNANQTPRKQPVAKNDLLLESEREIGLLYSQIQNNKQKISSLKASNEKCRDGRLSEEVSLSRVNQRWTKDECSLAKIGFGKFGQNFKAIAELLGTKTESHVRKFFMKNRKTQNLDSVVSELKVPVEGFGGAKQDESIEIMEIDSDDDVQQAKDSEMIGNMNEIIGIKKELEVTKGGKTSIMTTSTGKTLKRKQEEDVVKLDSEEISLLPSEPVKKKVAVVEAQSEITITPIPKVSEIKEPETTASIA